MKRAGTAGAALASAVLLAGCAGGTDEPVAEVVVPKVVGLDSLAAQQLLERSGLRWRWSEDAEPRPANAFLMIDTIYAQTPADGQKVTVGTVVTLVPASERLFDPFESGSPR